MEICAICCFCVHPRSLNFHWNYLMVESISATAETNTQPGRDPFLLIWEFLRQPLLLVVVGVGMLFFVLVGLSLPQLPGQCADDPRGATRWLLTTRNEYGALGALLNGLGLFNLNAQAPWCASDWPCWDCSFLSTWASSRPTFSAAADCRVCWPRPKVTPGSLCPLRNRADIPLPPTRWMRHSPACPGVVGARLGDRFDANPSVLVRRTQLGGGAADTSDGEMRWLVQGHTWAYYLRPLLLLGTLLALAVLWGSVNFGWEDLHPPPWPPAANFTFLGRGCGWATV